MRVHQVLPRFAELDEVAHTVLSLRLLLRRLGLYGELYALERDDALRSLVSPVRALRPAADDWVLYHHAAASPLSGHVLHLPGRKAVLYQPEPPAPRSSTALEREQRQRALAQLAGLARVAEVGLSFHALGEARLRQAGFAKTARLLPFAEPGRFEPPRRGDELTLVSVTSWARGDGLDEALAVWQELERIAPRARWTVLALGAPKTAEAARWRRALAKRARVERVDGSTLAARAQVLRTGSVFLSLSEHAGPPRALLEALAAQIPIVAFRAPGVDELLDGRGVAVDAKHAAVLAELIRLLHLDKALQGKLSRGEAKRAHALSPERAAARLSQVFQPKPPRRASRRSRPHVAVVVQRYGDVVGGAEAHARMLAAHLKPSFELTVLTTCARDHLTWQNDFRPGRQRLDGVPVVRFPVARPRQMRAFNRLSRARFGAPQDLLAEEHWLAEQGPLCPALLEHLADSGARYDAFIFFTYLYAPTVHGLPLVASRSLLVPTAHDEPALAFRVFDALFRAPRALMCNTPEEAALIRGRFPDAAPAQVVGVGVDAPAGDPDRFRRKHGLDRPYLLYVGRLEKGKGLPELVHLHAQLFERAPDTPELLLAGGGELRLKGPGVRLLGRISEQDKWDGLAGALAAVVPSRYESLSLLALEAFSQGTPVLGNARSAVLTGQIRRSGAGLTFEDARSYAEAVRKISAQRARLGAKGRAFSKRHTWSKVVAAYRREIARIVT